MVSWRPWYKRGRLNFSQEEGDYAFHDIREKVFTSVLDKSIYTYFFHILQLTVANTKF